MTTTTATHLRTVAIHWTDLHEALGQPAIIGGFGRGLRGYLAHLDTTDPDQTDTSLRAQDRDPMQLGVRPIPVRLHILETMNTVHVDLLECADAIAETVQRPPIAPPAPRRAAVARTRAERVMWEDHARRVQAAQEDAADRRRWRWTGPRPDAPYTALWLLARIEGVPGPFRRITEQEEQHISTVAKAAADRVERALDIAAQQRTLSTPCPDCGGPLDVHGGEGRLPVAHCTGCGRIWTEQTPAAA